jgi:hypothetical protein
MHLITFAHWPEARSFFDHFSPKRHAQYDWLYEFNRGIMIITNEGIHEAISKTTLSLGLYPQITEIYNFGVAGTLDHSIPLHQIKEIRTVYGFDSRPLFKSFTLQGTTDLVTSGERILSKEASSPLKSMGKLVDRELWGVVFAAKEGRHPLRSFKYISDMAGEVGACEVVKDLADKASFDLLNTYLSIAPKHESETQKIPGLYMTFSQERLLETLLKKLSIKFEKETSFWLESKELKDLQEEDLFPKERTKRFLKFLEKELDPFSHSLQEKMEDLFSSLQQEKISVTPSSQMETKDLKVAFQFGSKEELLLKTTMLKNFDFERYYKLWRGHLDVE